MIRRLIDQARGRPQATTAVAGLLIGLAAGLAIPPPSARDWTPGDAAWELPSQERLDRVAPGAFDTLRNAAPFRSQSGAGRQGAAPAWKLAGIMSDPSPVAMVIGDQGKILQVPLDGSLPDGAQLTSVEIVSIGYTRDGCEFTRKLYDATEHRGACLNTAGAAQEENGRNE